MGVCRALVSVRGGCCAAGHKGVHHLIVIFCGVMDQPPSPWTTSPARDTVTPGSLLFAGFIYIILDNIFFATESDIHQHVPSDVSPANGAVLGGVGDALDTYHAEDVTAIKGQRQGHGPQADGALRTLVVSAILVGLFFLLRLEVLMICLIVELEVSDLYIFGAAFAALRTRLAILFVAIMVSRRDLQLAMLTSHHSSGAKFLLVNEEL